MFILFLIYYLPFSKEGIGLMKMFNENEGSPRFMTRLLENNRDVDRIGG